MKLRRDEYRTNHRSVFYCGRRELGRNAKCVWKLIILEVQNMRIRNLRAPGHSRKHLTIV